MTESIPSESLITEQRNPRTMLLDRMSTPEILSVINEEDASVAPAVRLRGQLSHRVFLGCPQRAR